KPCCTGAATTAALASTADSFWALVGTPPTSEMTCSSRISRTRAGARDAALNLARGSLRAKSPASMSGTAGSKVHHLPGAFAARLRSHRERVLRHGGGHRFPVAARLSLARYGDNQTAPGLRK